MMGVLIYHSWGHGLGGEIKVSQSSWPLAGGGQCWFTYKVDQPKTVGKTDEWGFIPRIWIQRVRTKSGETFIFGGVLSGSDGHGLDYLIEETLVYLGHMKSSWVVLSCGDRGNKKILETNGWHVCNHSLPSQRLWFLRTSNENRWFYKWHSWPECSVWCWLYFHLNENCCGSQN